MNYFHIYSFFYLYRHLPRIIKLMTGINYNVLYVLIFLIENKNDPSIIKIIKLFINFTKQFYIENVITCIFIFNLVKNNYQLSRKVSFYQKTKLKYFSI